MISFTIKPKLTDQQVNVWVAWHSHDSQFGGLYLMEYEMWVRKFIRFINKDDIRTVDQKDVEAFLREVRNQHNGEMPVLKAGKAVNSILKFYSARGKQLERLYHS